MLSLQLSALALGALSAVTSVVASEAGKTDHLLASRYSPVGRPVKRGFQEDGNYNITIVHVNDLHAHLDLFRHTGVDCPADNVAKNISCFGGSARLLTKINEIKESVNDSIVLNAGDEFQGTLFYSYYKPEGSKIAEVLNQMPFDAWTLGNHEFDAGDEPLADFLANLTFPTISTNIKTNNTKLAAQLIPYLEMPQHNLSIVAVTTVDVPDIAQPGEGTTFEPYSTIQATVDGLLDGSIGNGTTTRVIALTHIGYDNDIALAKTLRGVSLLVGGHSHTALGGDPKYSQGDYPTLVKDADGEDVFVVTAYRWGEYLGRIDLAFGPDNKVAAYTGAPIIMYENMTADAQLDAQIQAYREPFDAFSLVVIGETLTELSNACYDSECTAGNAMTDAMVWSRSQSGAKIAGAIHNAGGLRSTITGPNITQGDVLALAPFGNQLVEMTFTGDQLWDIFEGVASEKNSAGLDTDPIQVSKEIKFTWNPNATVGARLISLEINGTSVQPATNYTIVTLDFIATGGDGIIPNAPKAAPPTLGVQDEVFSAYVRAHTPLNYTIEGRIVQTTSTTQLKPGSAAGNSSTGNSTTGAATGTPGSGAGVTIQGSLRGLGALSIGALFLGLAL